MQIAQVLAGYTLGRRRPAAPRDGQEEARGDGQAARGFRRRRDGARRARRRRRRIIFDLMEKFAGYGFNKSHSAAYAMLSYQTAWLKAHYPAAFMAAVLSCRHGQDRQGRGAHRRMPRAWGIAVLPPDVNASATASRSSGARQHPLRARRHQGRRRRGGRGDRRGAQRRRAVPTFTTCAAASTCARQQALPRGADQVRRLDRLGANRATLMAELTGPGIRGEQNTRAAEPRPGGSVRPGPRPRSRRRACDDWPERRSASPASARRSACSCPATRSRLRARPAVSAPGRIADWRSEARHASPGRGAKASGARASRRPLRDWCSTSAGAPNRVSLMLDDRQRPPRGDAVRRDLSAAPRHHRQGCDPAGRGLAALRRFHRGLAPAAKRSWTSTRRASASRGACWLRWPEAGSTGALGLQRFEADVEAVCCGGRCARRALVGRPAATTSGRLETCRHTGVVTFGRPASLLDTH